MSEATTENATATNPAPSKAKTKKSAGAKGAKTKAATPKTKPPKVTKPAKLKKEKAPKEDLMVFAFRMTKAESAELHRCAGPANASRTMRALAAAFVAEDRAAFETVVEDARKLR